MSKDYPKPVESGELRELLKTEMFAAIEYGRLNSDVTQDAVEASWFHHLDDIMEYVEDYLAQEKAKWVAEVLDRLESTAVYAEYDKAEDDVICGDVVPLDAIQAERAKLKEVK